MLQEGCFYFSLLPPMVFRTHSWVCIPTNLLKLLLSRLTNLSCPFSSIQHTPSLTILTTLQAFLIFLYLPFLFHSPILPQILCWFFISNLWHWWCPRLHSSVLFIYSRDPALTIGFSYLIFGPKYLSFPFSGRESSFWKQNPCSFVFQKDV